MKVTRTCVQNNSWNISFTYRREAFEWKGGSGLSNLKEIKQRIYGLKGLLTGMQERVTGMVKAVAPELQARFKKEGTHLGIGAVLGIIGLTLMAVGALYLVAAIILVVNLALDRLWLSALIVVGAMLVFGGIIAMIGAVMARSGAKKLQQTADLASKGATALAKGTVEEVQKEVVGLQTLVKQEVEDRKRQALELLAQARRVAPPAVAVLFLLLLVRRRRKSKKRKALAAEASVVIREVVYAEE